LVQGETRFNQKDNSQEAGSRILGVGPGIAGFAGLKRLPKGVD